MNGATAGKSSVLSQTIRRSRRLLGGIRTAGVGAAKIPLSILRPGSVAMFHIGRSGSIVLGDMLNQHPRVVWDREIYAPRRLGWEEETAMKPGDLTVDPAKLLRRRMALAGKRYYGFEAKFFHLELAGVGLSDYIEQLPGLASATSWCSNAATT